MVGSEQLRGQGAWWQRPLRWVSRFRQDPGTANLRTYAPLVEGIVSQRASLRCLTGDDLLRRSAGSVSIRLDDDDELVCFLGVASEVARRRLGLEPFEVQLLAAVSMLRGRVVDMATGEGKTLVGFLVSAGLAAAGRRVHVLSANDYLAGRDADAGAPLFSAFGLTCAAVVDGMGASDRAEAYRADVVYATVHQVGFDLLRDRQRLPEARRLVPGLDAAVVDEIDAVLLDDAMVPLVIAGDADPQPEEASLAQVIADLTEDEHYQVEGDRRSVAFTEAGIARVESALGIDDLFAQEHVELLTAAHVARHAHALVERDVHYLVTDGRVQLVNDARGRVADRQRWPDGLHAAIERKEGLEVTGQAEILDQVLVETVARGYRTLTGMSGIALKPPSASPKTSTSRPGSSPPTAPASEKMSPTGCSSLSSNAIPRRPRPCVQPMMRGSRCSSVPAAWPILSASPDCSPSWVSKRGCSTRRTTLPRRRSSPAPASTVRSPCPHRWPAEASTSNSVQELPRPAACSSSGSDGTTPRASIGSCGAGRAGRVIPAGPCSTPALKTTW